METEEIAKKLFSILSDMSDTQKRQTAVTDKLADGLARAVYIIDDMQQRVKSLEKRVETLEEEAKE